MMPVVLNKSVKRRPTLANIAEEVGVTTATVSYVLNGRHMERISPATQKKVFAVARKLKYAPDYHARSLVTGRTNTLAIYFPQRIEKALQNPYEMLLFRGILQKSVVADYSIQILIEGHNSQSVSADGWLCVHAEHQIPSQFHKGKPVIYINPAWGFEPRSLQTDLETAARLLSQSLRKTAKRALFVMEDASHPSYRSQQRMFELVRAGLEDAAPVIKFMLSDSTFLPSVCLDYVKSSKIDTIITSTDELAIPIWIEALNRKIKVPDQLQIAACEKLMFSCPSHASITAIDSKVQELGYRAATMLLKHLEKFPNKTEESLYGPPKPVLVKGETTR
jgi:DNA-binding LacI/PurR family transcriptional regulator